MLVGGGSDANDNISLDLSLRRWWRRSHGCRDLMRAKGIETTDVNRESFGILGCSKCVMILRGIKVDGVLKTGAIAILLWTIMRLYAGLQDDVR